MTQGLSVLLWSPRLAPGLLSAEAWDLLRAADVVLCADRDHPFEGALADARVGLQDVGMTLPAPAPAGAGATARREEAPPVAELAAHLSALARKRHVLWLPAADGDPELRAALAALGTRVSTVIGSRDLPGAEVLDLVRVMDRLRSPGGCAWDAAQTHESLLTYLIEETYETVEAIETDDLVELREELGDLLLQVVFHARIGQEHVSDAWSLDDVARGVTEKLVRRHPHVFGDGSDGNGGAAGVGVGDLEVQWDALKTAEKGRTSATDGVPMGQPALSLAAKLRDRATRAGVAPPVDLSAVPVRSTTGDVELGEMLLAVVLAARAADLDPEAALRAAARRYASAVRGLEAPAL